MLMLSSRQIKISHIKEGETTWTYVTKGKFI